jgi:hypothetical protein
MKKWIVRYLGLGLVCSLPAWIAGCSDTPAKPTAEFPAVTNVTNVVVETKVEAAETNAEDATDLANAPAQVVSAPKATPATVRSYGPVADLAKLAESGVAEGVLQAFVANCPNRFDLTPDEIIYLNDIGLPSSIVTAALQHDQSLKAAAASAAASPAPAASQPATPVAAEPPLVAPAPIAPAAPETTTVVSTTQPAVIETYPSPTTDVVLTSFDSSLSPYGSWIYVAGYGRCWQPSVVMVNPGWQPYFDGGHWVYTDCGWYWASDYSWGWAPFHYGRWFRHNHFGWCWAPDTIWGPSWVCWRYNERHCGWAPLPPGARYHHGSGMIYHGAEVGLRFDFGLDVGCFAFIEWGRFHDHHLRGHEAPREQASRIYHQSTMASAFVATPTRIANRGLAPEQVAAASRVPVHTVAIREHQETRGTPSRGERLVNNGRTLEVFHPAIPQPGRSAGSSRIVQPGVPAQPHLVESSRPASPARPSLDRPEPVSQPAGRTPTTSATTSARSSAERDIHVTRGSEAPAPSTPATPRSTVTTIGQRSQPGNQPRQVGPASENTRSGNSGPAAAGTSIATPPAPAGTPATSRTVTAQPNNASSRAQRSGSQPATTISATAPASQPSRVERPTVTQRAEPPARPSTASPWAATDNRPSQTVSAPATPRISTPAPAPMPSAPATPRAAPIQTPRPTVPTVAPSAPRMVSPAPSAPTVRETPAPRISSPAPSAPASPSRSDSGSGSKSTSDRRR